LRNPLNDSFRTCKIFKRNVVKFATPDSVILEEKNAISFYPISINPLKIRSVAHRIGRYYTTPGADGTLIVVKSCGAGKDQEESFVGWIHRGNVLENSRFVP
jgi:hypothetical protein